MKISITPDKVKAASATREIFGVRVDTTGKSRGEVANILLDLAARLEGQDSLRERADALRAKIAARHPALTVSPEVRLEPSHDDVIPVHGAGGESLGTASFFEEKPVPVWVRAKAPARPKAKKTKKVDAAKTAYARKKVAQAQGGFGDFVPSPAVLKLLSDDEPVWDSTWEEDDLVEFFHRQKWVVGYVIGQPAHDEYEIEGEFGQRWIVPIAKIRHPRCGR